MSYIRCLSNPEGMYIWGESDGRVSITSHGIEGIVRMPTHVFEGLFRRWHADGHWSDARYRGASLTELTVPSSQLLQELVKERNPDLFKLALHWKEWDRPVVAYDVTWRYVCENVAFRPNTRRRKK